MNVSDLLKPIIRQSLVSGLIGGILALVVTASALSVAIFLPIYYIPALSWVLMSRPSDLTLLGLAIPIAVGLYVSSSTGGIAVAYLTPRAWVNLKTGVSRLARFVVMFPNLLKLTLFAGSFAAAADYVITLYTSLKFPWGSALEANRIVIFLSSFMPFSLALTVTFLYSIMFLLSLFLLVRGRLKETPYSGTIPSFFKRLRSTASLWDFLLLVILGVYIGATFSYMFGFVGWWGLIT